MYFEAKNKALERGWTFFFFSHWKSRVFHRDNFIKPYSECDIFKKKNKLLRAQDQNIRLR